MQLGYGNSLIGQNRPRGASFVGALDAYAGGLVHLCCLPLRLLSSYEGPAFRMRVDTGGSPEYDVNFLADGTFDAAAVTANAAGNNWFVVRVYDQSGHGRDLFQATTGAQPRGAVDGNGLAYGYAPGVGFSTTFLTSATGIALALTDTTEWSVASSAGYALDLGTIRNAALTERRCINYSGSIQTVLPGAGTDTMLAGTATGLYTTGCQVRAAGNRLSNGLAAATGTKASAAFTIDQVGFGFGAGGPSWSQNSRFYARGLWSSDLGNTAVDDLHTLVKPLFHTL